MVMPMGRMRRVGAGRLLAAGAGHINLDQRLTRPAAPSTKDALAGDREAVGADLRRAISAVRKEVEAV